ncbi:NfeD family protein [Mogibacterium neglectum]|mgnify:FL=1|uniref:NfeD family protein n=1 Tax=Mogibacterium neglectum TaxID=114528 RepID=UPI00272BBAD7|nr:NfeD family protein [Mogibacterium neglectum]WLD75890.1 NfeD family protein [Mogibacterium neglectum]
MKKVITYIKNHIPLRQIIPLILLTIMFRLAIGGLYELFVESYMDTYGNESKNAYVSGLDIVLTGFGIFMCLYAIVVYIVERRSHLPFWYGRCQSAGSNANAVFEAAIGTSLLRLSPAVTAVIAMIFIIIFTIVSNITTKHREEIKQRYVGHIGRTVDDLKLKGKVDFGGEVLHALGREVIPKDTEVKAVDIDGYNIVVERLIKE